MRVLRNTNTILVRNLEGKRPYRKTGILGWIIILKWFLQK
jgi:hypothetical protein